jgi:hypothetical protein
MRPAGQAVQADAPAAEYVPMGHAEHTLDPGYEYVPAAQATQADAADEPALALYRPALHAVQEAAFATAL